MKPDRGLQMLSIAMRAGKIGSGEFQTEESVKNGSAWLVIAACDASENTRKKFINMCDYYDVPILFYSDKDTLGHIIGKEERAVLCVNDEGLAREVSKRIGGSI